MTRLRPVVVPVAALALATAAPNATAAQQRRPVTQWANTPSAHSLAAELAVLAPRAALVQPAISLPLAALTPSGEAAVPDVRHAPAASPAAAGAAGRPLVATARGPPV